MFTFLKILFFSQVVLLTSSYIDVDDELTLVLEEPIAAITTGAHIEIDITNMVRKKDLNITNAIDAVLKLFPSGSLRVQLSSDQHENIIQLIFIRGIAWKAEDDIRLILREKTGIPVDVEFNKVQLKTDIPLKKIKIYWRNYSQ